MNFRLALATVLFCTLAVSVADFLTPLPALAATPATDALIIPLRPADTSVTCQVGDHLQITGSVTMQNTFDSCLLLVDGVVAEARTPSIPVDNYSFTWTPQTPGTHTLELRYTTFHAKATVRRLLVTAADAPPAVLSGLPASAATDTAVSVVGAGPRPFPLARVDFYFNGKPLVVATSAPFAATLPIEAITQPGTYPVKFIAYDGLGRPFYAHASKIEVPQRVQVTAPRAFTLRNAGDKANLAASVLPGIKVAKVSYTIAHANSTDYQVVADATAAPFSADVDLSSRASGDYWVNAIATSAAGNSYEAWAVQLTLTNMPDDKRVVQEAKDRAKAEAERKAQLGYQITDLGTLPGDSESIAIGINDKGQVVGQSVTFTNAHNTPQGHAFLWQGGEMIDIGTLTGFSSSSALSINDGGKIVGLADNFASIEDMHDASGTYLTPVTHAFLWDNSRLNDLDILAGRTAEMANCINNNDEIVGYLGIPHPRPFALVYHPFVWRRGQMTDLGVIGHYEMNYGVAINDQGSMIWNGSNYATKPPRMMEHAFLAKHSGVTDLGLLPGYMVSSAGGINEQDDVTGRCGRFDKAGHEIDDRAFLWHKGKMVNLGVLPGTTESSGNALNDSDQVVGTLTLPMNNTKAFIWEKGRMIDLNTKIPKDGIWILTAANAINNHGWIVGEGKINGHKHGFLLVPDTAR